MAICWRGFDISFSPDDSVFGKVEKAVTLMEIVGMFNDNMTKKVGNDISLKEVCFKLATHYQETILHEENVSAEAVKIAYCGMYTDALEILKNVHRKIH